MSKKRSVERRRGPRKQSVMPFEQRDFPKEIIKRLETAAGISGRRPSEVFSDWAFITEATLKALPAQVKAVGATGHFAEDAPAVADTFARVRVNYDPKYLGEDRAGRVWRNLTEAFALLLEATAPGLWGQPNSLNIAGPLSGPDILGYIYQTWVNTGSSAEVYSPWPVARLLAEMTLGQTGERLVYDRLKAALCHPDNILGAATLLAGLILPEDEPDVIRDYFINRVVPMSAGFYEPVRVCDPAIGSSILNLAAASIMPDWMVRLGLIVFAGQDISRIAVSISRIQAQLYGLNGYALHLQAVVTEAMTAHRQQAGGQSVALPQSPAQIIRHVYRNDHVPSTTRDTGPSFEQIFKATAMRQPAAAEAVSV